MRRDMDLIRDMLLTTGDAPAPVDARTFVDDAHDWGTVVYNLDMIRQANLAEIRFGRTALGVVRATVGPLTWAGNEYVDAIRDNNVWKKVKRTLAQTVGGATLDTVKALAVKIATDMLMEPALRSKLACS